MHGRGDALLGQPLNQQTLFGWRGDHHWSCPCPSGNFRANREGPRPPAFILPWAAFSPSSPSAHSALLSRVLGKHISLGLSQAGAQSVTLVWFLKVCHHGHHWEGGGPGRREPEGLGHDCWGDLPGLQRDRHHQHGESPPVFFSNSTLYYRNFKTVAKSLSCKVR